LFFGGQALARIGADQQDVLGLPLRGFVRVRDFFLSGALKREVVPDAEASAADQKHNEPDRDPSVPPAPELVAPRSDTPKEVRVVLRVFYRRFLAERVSHEVLDPLVP
jgi:hypothetical protein